jgi:hypothetical protein
MQASVPHVSPQLGLFASTWRLLFGDRAKRAHVSDHGAFMRTLGRAWAVPMTLVFSFGALITLGQHQITILVGQYQRHEPLDFVVLALLAITFVIVGGMDLTLLNSAVELRDARLRGVDPAKDPYTRGARLRVWLVSLIESATFMSVAYQLEKPPSFSADLLAASVAWAFIVARADRADLRHVPRDAGQARHGPPGDVRQSAAHHRRHHPADSGEPAVRRRRAFD